MTTKISKFSSFLILGLFQAFALAQPSGTPKHGFDASYMDTTVKPADDFYRYANGAWLKTATIPGKRSSWGMAQEVYERNTQVLVGLMRELAERGDWPQGSLEQKISDFYRSGMDEAAIEKAGLDPLASRFSRLQRLRGPRDLAVELGRLHAEGIISAFDFRVYTDNKNSTATIPYLMQGGLGLFTRDSYLKDDDRSKELREKYRRHAARMFELLGDGPDQAARNVTAVLAIETRLAKAALPQRFWEDPKGLYNKMTRRQLAAEAPGFDWETYFKTIGLPDTETHLMVQPLVFFREFAVMAAAVPPADWRAYLRWHLINNLAPYVNAVFEDQDFDFYRKTLMGVKEKSPRRERVQQTIQDSDLDMAVGRLYVERAFSVETKRKALEMVTNIMSALRETILGLPWMSEPTKRTAVKKLDTMSVKIGYPDRWRDYSGLEVDRGPYVLNVLRANAFAFKRVMAQLGKAVDRDEWELSPAVVSAFCHPWRNEMCFAAAFLQPPFFDPQADDACNYGAVGTIIGHELTHDFDSSGRQYDEVGNLRDWWTPEDAAAFQARTVPFVAQYGAYKPLPDLAIDGKRTLDENIADLGGLKIAYLAFQKSLAGKPRPAPIDGFTPEQRFFISFAQVYRNLTTAETLRRRLESDEHSPMEFRVIGPLSDFAPFQEVFGIKPGDRMWTPLDRRPAIW